MRSWLPLAIGIIAIVVAVCLAIAFVRRKRGIRQMLRALDLLDQGEKPRVIDERGVGLPRPQAARFNQVVTRLDKRLGDLQGDQRLLETVFESMSEGVIAVDSRRRLLFSNRAARTLFGLPNDAEGRLIAELVRRPQVQAVVESAVQLQEAYQAEINVETTGPNRARAVPLTLRVQASPIPGPSEPGAVFVFHDVTELRRLERMRQDFVANASHELKTPLASIRAYTETLLDGAVHDDAVNLRFLKQIADQADRLTVLVLDMLSLARLDAGAEAFDHEPLDIARVVRERINDHRARAEAKQIRLFSRLDQLADDVQVLADEEAVRQILDNLIDNAIKYTPNTGRVRVVGRAIDDRVVLEVSDTGIGIPRDDLPRVFERFYRVDKGRSRAEGGTGLGLAIVKNLVLTLGGRVHVESRINAGSTFMVDLPRYAPSTLPTPADPHAADTARNP